MHEMDPHCNTVAGKNKIIKKKKHNKSERK